MANQFTTKEVLNKVLLDSSGNAVTANSVTTQEAFNSALDTTNNRLNMSLAGGTISGDVTISGDLTISGSNTYTYDEQIDGQLWLKDSTASGSGKGGHLRLFSDDDAAMAAGDRLGVIEFAGAEDTSHTITVGARIEALAESTYTASENGSSLSFYTTDGNASQSEVLKLDSNKLATFSGNLTFTHSGATISSTLGFLQLRTLEGDKNMLIDCGDKFKFRDMDSGNAVRVAIDSANGNLSIGTETATNNLHIEATAGDGGITIHSATNTGNAVILDAARTGTDNGIGTIVGKWDGTDIGYMGFFSGSNTGSKGGVLKFATAPNGGSATVALTIGSDQSSTFSGVTTIKTDSSPAFMVDDANGDTQFQVNVNASDGAEIEVSDGGSDGRVRFSARSGGYNYITNAGTCRLGIGTDSPSELLHLESAEPVLRFTDSDDSNYHHIFASSDDLYISADRGETGTSAGNLIFRVGGTNVKMKLDVNSRISLGNNDSSGVATNTIFGYQTANVLASGALENTLYGYQCGLALSTGDYNTAFGALALKTEDVGQGTTAIGTSALFSQNTASQGFSHNTGVGLSTSYYNVTGVNNTAIGSNAMLGVSGNSHSNNTAIGFEALKVVTTGHSNVAIGAGAGDALVNGVENVIIGKNAEANSTDAGNCIVIGSTATGKDHNSVTLGNASVTDVYMAQNSGATVHARHMNLIDSVDNASGGILNLKNDRDNPADNDEAGRIYMYADDDGGNATEAILMIGRMTDVTDGTEDSDLRIYTYNNGTAVNTLQLSSGALSKNSGSFKIDHPLESKKDTHHLVHSFVEAPQADNIYRGKATLSSGSVEINLDTVSGMSEGTFVLLNTDIQCFTSNESDWDAVKGSVSGNILTISCQNTDSTATVSWLVIGERQDQHMLDTNWTDENGKVIVEPLKN